MHELAGAGENAVRSPVTRMGAGIAGPCVVLCGAFGGGKMSVKNLWNADGTRESWLAVDACLTRGKTQHASLAALEPR